MGRIVEWWRSIRAKMVHEPLKPEDVAGGWALGMFVGCAIPFGLQLVVSVPLAMMMRVSKVGATLGTLITNPVTIFFIYPAQTWAMYNLIFGSRELHDLPEQWTWSAVRALGVDVLVSFLLGGLVLGLVLSPITYFAVKRLVIKYRQHLADGKPLLPRLKRRPRE